MKVVHGPRAGIIVISFICFLSFVWHWGRLGFVSCSFAVTWARNRIARRGQPRFVGEWRSEVHTPPHISIQAFYRRQEGHILFDSRGLGINHKFLTNTTAPDSSTRIWYCPKRQLGCFGMSDMIARTIRAFSLDPNLVVTGSGKINTCCFDLRTTNQQEIPGNDETTFSIHIGLPCTFQNVLVQPEFPKMYSGSTWL